MKHSRNYKKSCPAIISKELLFRRADQIHRLGKGDADFWRWLRKVHITLDIAEELVNDIDQSWAFKNRAIKNDEKDVQKLSRFYNGEKSSHFFGGEQAAKPLSPNFCLLYPY